ncbi:MAG: hypothetical protein LBC73_00860 [Oscillospiraceae bacterium]|jgi:hypothetical protein|nr:hypothetical protein [Oscillospiraceae bacterium]
MRGYELTDRGKIVVAIILVLIFLVTPAAIMAINAAANSAGADDDPGNSNVSPDPSPDVTNGPPYQNGGLDPPETPSPTPSPTPGENGSSDIVDPPDPKPDYGFVSLNVTEGTLVFIFSTDIQTELDAETASYLPNFLDSPKNTALAKIEISMPVLPEKETSEIITAVVDAFSDLGVTQQDMVFSTFLTNTDNRLFEINLSFYVATDVK